MLNDLNGTGVALITPFDASLEVDYNSLRKIVEYHTENGTDYLVVMGTTGESATLTSEEKSRVLSFVKENNTRKLPLVYGIGGNNTAEVISNIKNTDFNKVDALLSVSPYYNKPSQQGLIEHFTKIADASPVPVILYNVPGRTASNISASTTLSLSGHKNIIGIKEASGDLSQCIEIAKNAPEDFLLISGDDMLTVPLISIGASGVISVMANAFPSLFKEMVHGALNNDYNIAREATFQLSQMNTLMYTESNPTGVKQVMKELGLCENYVRLPLVKATGTLQKEISQTLKKINGLPV